MNEPENEAYLPKVIPFEVMQANVHCFRDGRRRLPAVIIDLPRMTYLEALSFLGETRWFGMKLGLENMRSLASALGNPQENLRFIHLAGTNGKGSTAAFCESILRANGFRVGLYTSPHLISIRERIQIDRVPISEEDFAEGMTVVREALGRIEGQQATFFELITAVALRTFAEEKVDWVIWETGLGGRLDATNIVTPEVCIITNIGLDHQQYLGESLAQIAGEKAGIIKAGVAVITAEGNCEAAGIIHRRAKALESTVTFVQRDSKPQDLGWDGTKQLARINGQDYALGLIGAHQIDNAACAAEAMWQLRIKATGPHEELSRISDAAIARGLSETVWPGRFQILSESPLTVLDGAHNPAGMESLVKTWCAFLEMRFGQGAKIEAGTHLVFGSVADKAIEGMVELLRPYLQKVSLVRLANERSADPGQLAKAFSGLPCTLFDSVSELMTSLDGADPAVPVLVTGSLFLVGEMLAGRQVHGGEYQLNERLEKLTTTR